MIPSVALSRSWTFVALLLAAMPMVQATDARPIANIIVDSDGDFVPDRLDQVVSVVRELVVVHERRELRARRRGARMGAA